MTLYTPPSSLSPQALPSCSEEATQQYLLSSLRQTRRSSHPSSLDVLPPNAKRSRRADPSSMAGCPSLPTYAEPKHDWLHRSSSSTVEPLSLESIVHPSAWCDTVVAPAAPNLEAHCPTPGLTPEDSSEEEEGEFVVESSAPLPPSPPASFRLGGAAAASSGFVKRDDLTARAVAKAAEMCGAAQTKMPPRQEVQQQQQQGEKDRFVNGLVDASVLAIHSIWGPSLALCPSQHPSSTGVLPLQYFVKEVLRRSRTSCSTLQLALYYLHKSRSTIRGAVGSAEKCKTEIVRLEKERRAARASSPSFDVDAYPSPPHSPPSSASSPSAVAAADATYLSAVDSSLTQQLTFLIEAQNSPVLCGRRMFLAALISASKYLQDRNYSNRAWAKISGLEVREINTNERAFLKLVDFQLHLKAEDFGRWTERLSILSSPSSPSSSPPAAATASPALLARHGLARSASDYPSVALPPPALTPPGPALPASAAHIAAQRLALSRGASAPTFSTAAVTPLASSAASSMAALAAARSKGFPIAQARGGLASTAASFPDAATLAAFAPASSSSIPSATRQLRALPSRRTGIHPAMAAMDVDGAGVRSTAWVAGRGGATAFGGVGGVGVGRGEEVRAH